MSFLPSTVRSEGLLRIDWSGFSGVEKCQRYAGHELGWRRVKTDRDAAQGFGKALHAALDMRQRALMMKLEVEPSNLEAMLEAEFAGVELPEDEYRTLGRAKDVLSLYLETYPTESFDILENESFHERELGVVEVRGVGSVRVIWQGLIDGVWRDQRQGKLTIKDTKTMKECQIERERAKYQMGGQLKGYCWLKSTPEAPVRDAVIDVIVVRPPLSRPTVKSLPRNECWREVFTFSEEQILDWRRDTLATLEQWLEACAASTPPPMRSTSCAWPRLCQYYEVCEQRTEADRMRWLLEGSYVENTWSPDPAKRGVSEVEV